MIYVTHSDFALSTFVSSYNLGEFSSNLYISVAYIETVYRQDSERIGHLFRPFYQTLFPPFSFNLIPHLVMYIPQYSTHFTRAILLRILHEWARSTRENGQFTRNSHLLQNLT